MVSRAEPDHYAALVDLATVEHYIFETNPRSEDLRVLHAGPVDRSEYVYPSGLVDALALSRLYEDGYSIVLPMAHEHLPPLGYLIRGLEAELGCRAQANVYLSPPGAAAFAPHYDNHDVFVLQAHGIKHWILYEPPHPLPTKLPFDPDRDEVGAELDHFDLATGDLCYLPRGLMHEATATTGASLHVTIGVHWVSVLDVLQDALRRAGERRADLRRALPPSWWSDGAARDEAVEEAVRALASVAGDELFLETLGGLRDDLVSTRQPLVPGQLEQLRRIEELAPRTVVTRRDPMVWDLRCEPSQVVLACFGSEIAFPLAVAEALAQLLESADGVAVEDLAGPLDLEEKLVLVRRLVREGVIEARW